MSAQRRFSAFHFLSLVLIFHLITKETLNAGAEYLINPAVASFTKENLIIKKTGSHTGDLSLAQEDDEIRS